MNGRDSVSTRRRVRVERGVYRQPNGKFAVCFMLDGRPRFRTVDGDLDAARSARARLALAAQAGLLPACPRLTFATVAARWLERFETMVAVGERRVRTLESHRYHLERHLLPALGRRRIATVTVDDIADLIRGLVAQGRAPRTITGALATLGSILRYALRRGYITDNPLPRLEAGERPRPVPSPQRALGQEEIARLLAACAPRYRLLIVTALYTGMRISELLALTWRDVNFAAGVIHVHAQLSRAQRDVPAERVAPKTAAAIRDIPLVDQLAGLLHEHQRATAFAQPGDYVFATGNRRRSALRPGNAAVTKGVSGAPGARPCAGPDVAVVVAWPGVCCDAVMPGRRATSRRSPRRGRGAGRTGRGRSVLWRVAGCRSSCRRS
jgi:integrase